MSHTRTVPQPLRAYGFRWDDDQNWYVRTDHRGRTIAAWWHRPGYGCRGVWYLTRLDASGYMVGTQHDCANVDTMAPCILALMEEARAQA